MADADEDEIPTGSTLPSSKPGLNTENASPAASDDEGETPDFRFLTSGAKQSQSTIPKRGTKDFEPNPTSHQANTLDASRRAMHDALSALRVHAAGKTHNLGVYVDWARADQRELWSGYRGMEGSDWRKRCVVVFRFKSTHAKTVGRSDRRGWTWLLPEEALYLVERGSLDVRWPMVGDEGQGLRGGGEEDVDGASEEEEEQEPEPEIGELPMSLQGAYASFIGKSGLTFERYLIYAGLKRSGYIVQRAPTWDHGHTGGANGHVQPSTPPPVDDDIQPKPAQPGLSPPTLIHRLLTWLINPHRGVANPCYGPLLAPGLYRSYNDIFRALALIPYHTTNTALATSTQSSRPPSSPFTISFILYKPTPYYRKTVPPAPDYQVCVVDARESSVPTISQIGDLLDSMPEDELQGEGRRIEARMKHGRRNVLVAVADMGVVSYLRFSESEIGRYKLYEERQKKGGKGRGGQKRGKGQGQGQGQGQGGKKAAT